MRLFSDIVSAGGHHKAFPIICQKIIHYCASTHFYIGYTSDPSARASAHSAKYADMIVLYETSVEGRARLLESWLIKVFRRYCDNRTGGGGGGASSYLSNYYVYIARRRRRGKPRNWSIRRS